MAISSCWRFQIERARAARVRGEEQNVVGPVAALKSLDLAHQLSVGW
jgi:hypothetical protein